MRQSTILTSEKIIVNGVELPPLPNGAGFTNCSVVDNRVFVNGYELRNGKWKKTLRALWHKLF